MTSRNALLICFNRIADSNDEAFSRLKAVLDGDGNEAIVCVLNREISGNIEQVAALAELLAAVMQRMPSASEENLDSRLYATSTDIANLPGTPSPIHGGDQFPETIDEQTHYRLRKALRGLAEAWPTAVGCGKPRDRVLAEVEEILAIDPRINSRMRRALMDLAKAWPSASVGPSEEAALVEAAEVLVITCDSLD